MWSSPPRSWPTVLAALGVDASTPEKAALALAEHQQARWRRTLPATVVMREGWTPWFAVHLPHGSTAEVWVDLEDGGQRRDIPQQDHLVEPEWIDGVQVGEATFQLPGDLPLGYHRLCARIGTNPEISVSTLIVTPTKLEPQKLHRTWGWVLQLYSVRSRRSWGIGDLHDLADLAAWSAQRPGRRLRPGEPAARCGDWRAAWSPRRTCRRRDGSRTRSTCGSRTSTSTATWPRPNGTGSGRWRCRRGRSARTRQRSTGTRSWAAKREALQVLFGVQPSIGRIAEYGAYCDREGQGLIDFATWAAIADVHGPEWSKWPEELQEPTVTGRLLPSATRTRMRWSSTAGCSGSSTSSWRGRRPVRRRPGMSLGVVHDLAVGVHPDGADAWALQNVLAAEHPRRCTAGRVQPARPGLVAAAVAAGRAGRDRVRRLAGPGPRGDAARRRAADRPHPRACSGSGG